MANAGPANNVIGAKLMLGTAGWTERQSRPRSSATRSRVCSLARQAFEERQPEVFEPPKRYSVSDAPHGVKVKVQIMQRVKGRRRDLADVVEMPQIGA